MEKKSCDNLAIWEKVKTPDPKYIKDFKRSGGFNGSATNNQYNIMRATELFGPNGIGWGMDITDESYREGAPIFVDGIKVCNEVVHVIRGFIWYMKDGEKHCTSQQFGQTTFIGKNKYGPFTDEEAPKKSVTDMMSKCLSLLGFSADIFLGLWDDVKYVNDVRDEYAEKSKVCISSDQKNQLVVEFKRRDINVERYLAVLGVQSVDDIASDDFAKAMALTEKKPIVRKDEEQKEDVPEEPKEEKKKDSETPDYSKENTGQIECPSAQGLKVNGSLCAAAGCSEHCKPYQNFLKKDDHS